jgi:hypothetical protein
MAYLTVTYMTAITLFPRIDKGVTLDYLCQDIGEMLEFAIDAME